jgi:hypothetical protein
MAGFLIEKYLAKNVGMWNHEQDKKKTRYL